MMTTVAFAAVVALSSTVNIAQTPADGTVDEIRAELSWFGCPIDFPGRTSAALSQ